MLALTLADSLESVSSTVLFDMPGEDSAVKHTSRVPPQTILPGVHRQFFHLYKDFHGLAELDSPPTHLRSLIDHCKAHRSNTREMKPLLANLRRTAMTHLLLDAPSKALAVAEQIIRLQFDWPYGHLMQADALLALDRLVAANSAYQLALHLMGVSDPVDDIGRPEVLQLCRDVVEAIAQRCCRTLTLAHGDEVSSVAAWPRPTPAWSTRPRHARGDSGAFRAPRRKKMPVALQVHVDNAVNSALEVISKKGCIASAFQLSAPQGTPPPGKDALPRSPPTPLRPSMYFSSSETVSNNFSSSSVAESMEVRPKSASLDNGKTIDNLLSDEMARACRDSTCIDADAGNCKDDFEADAFADIFNTGTSSALDDPHDDPLCMSRFGDPMSTSSPTGASSRQHGRAGRAAQRRGGAAPPSRNTSSPGAIDGATLKSDATMMAYSDAELGVCAGPTRSLTSTQDDDLTGDSPFMSTEGEGARWGSLGGSTPKRFLATASMDCTVKVWDVEEMVCVNVLHGHDQGVNLVVWADTMRSGLLLMASASIDGVVVIWVLCMEGTLLEQRILLGHRLRVTNMSFTPGASKLITAGADGTICIWRVSNGKLLGKLGGHTRGITSLAMLPINGAVALVSSDTAGKWCLWDFDSRECVVTGKERHGCSLCAFTPRIPNLSPPRPLLLTCQWSQSKQEATLNLWDVFEKGATANSSLKPVHVFEGMKGRISDISVTVDNNNHALLAIGCMDGGLTMVDLNCRTVLSQIRDAHIDSEGYVMPILQVMFSLDGRLLFTSGADCSIKVWSTADMEVLLTLQGHGSPVTCVCPSDAGTTLASGSETGELAIWSLELVEELASSAQPSFRA